EERRPAASRSDVNAPRSRFELVAALAQRRADALEVRFDAGGLSTSAEQEQIEAVDVMRDEIVLANRAEQIAVERKYRELGTRRKVLGDLEIEVERRAFRRVGMPGHESADASDRKSTRLNSSHVKISYAVFCLKKKK